MLTSRLAACKDFQQVTGNEEPQDSSEAQKLSQAEVMPIGHVLKMVEEKRMPWEEVERLNKELQVCLQPLEGEKSPLGESGMVTLAVTLQKMHANGFWRKWKMSLAMNSSITSLWVSPIQLEKWPSEQTHGRGLHVADSTFLRACI